MKKGVRVFALTVSLLLLIAAVSKPVSALATSVDPAQSESAAANTDSAAEATDSDTAGTDGAAEATDSAAETTATSLIAPPGDGAGSAPTLISDYAVVMDAETGVVLYGKEADTAVSPASLTKIMTTYLALQAGTLSDEVTMTDTGVAMAFSGSSNLYTQVGEIFTLEQLLYGTMVKSANDMATQVGEYIGGTLDSFVERMNAEAAALGASNVHFTNVCGWPDEDNTASARDLAVISRFALQNETFRKMAGTTEYVIPSTNMTNYDRPFSTNLALITDPEWKYEGVFGGKTGMTDIALQCLATYCEKDGRTLIVIVMHAPTMEDALQDTTALLDYGYNNFSTVILEDPELPGYTGQAVLKNGVTFDDLTKRVDVKEDEENGELYDFSYSYEDEVVGHIVLSAAEYTALMEPETPEEEESAVEEPVEEEPVIIVTPVIATEKEEVALPHSFGELIVWLEDGANKLLFGLVIAILISLIIAIALFIANASKRRKARKRKKAREKARGRR